MSKQQPPQVVADLYARVLAQPDDDAVRLVYADALAEAGGDAASAARAELITISCELDKSRWRFLERPELHARYVELLERHEHEWIAPLVKLGVMSVRFHRGLVSEITIRAPAFAKHASKILALAPIRVVQLAGLEELRVKDLETLLAMPELARLDQIGFPGATINPSRVAAIFSKTRATTQIRSIDLTDTSWDEYAIRSVYLNDEARASRVNLTNVTARVVGMQGAQPRAIGAELLRLFPEARDVIMRGPSLAVRELVLNLRARKLGTLDLEVTGSSLLEASECERLCSHKLQLTELRLLGLQRLEDFLTPLRQAPYLSELRAFALGDLGSWRSVDGGKKQLASTLSQMSALEELFLRNVGLDNVPLRSILDQPSLSKLRSLTLRKCRIGDAGVQALVESTHLESLLVVTLASEKLSGPMVEKLRARFRNVVLY